MGTQMNAIIVGMSIFGILMFVVIKVSTDYVNRKAQKEHDSNPVFRAHDFRYEPIRLPWVFKAMLAISSMKLLEQILIIAGLY